MTRALGEVQSTDIIRGGGGRLRARIPGFVGYQAWTGWLLCPARTGRGTRAGGSGHPCPLARPWGCRCPRIGGEQTALTPAASAVRRIVPRLPGSWILSHTSARAGPSGAAGNSHDGIGKAATTPWGCSVLAAAWIARSPASCTSAMLLQGARVAQQAQKLPTSFRAPDRLLVVQAYARPVARPDALFNQPHPLHDKQAAAPGAA